MPTAIALALTLLLTSATFALAQGGTLPGGTPPGGNVIGQSTPCVNGEIPKANNSVWQCAADSGAGTGAPTDATYITQTPNGSLSAEQPLSALGSALLLNTTGTGVLSAYLGASCTNQFPRSVDALGAWTCASVTTADLNFAPLVSGSVAGGDLAGTFPNPTIAPNAVTLGTDTTGDYVSGVTANQGLLKTGTEGASVGLQDCAANESLRRNAGDTAWECFTPSAGGSSIILDLADDGSNESTALSELATDEVNPFLLTEPTPDKALLNTGRVFTRWPDVDVASTTDIALSGNQTIDGVVNPVTVLVTGQASAAQNGPYSTAAGTWSRIPSADAATEFLIGRQIRVNGGTVNQRTIWEYSTVGAITLNTTPLLFTKLAPGPSGEVLANKNTSNGYMGLDAQGNATFDRVGGFVQHSNLSVASQITISARQMGIQSTGGAVNLTSNPNVAAGTRDGVGAILLGTSVTDTVTIDDESVDAGSGVHLCGRKGSVTLALGGQTLALRWNAGLLVWQQAPCQDLQGAYNVGPTIYGAVDAASAVKIGLDANNHVRLMFEGGSAKVQGIVGGALAPSVTESLGAGGVFEVQNSAAAMIFRVDETDGEHHGPGAAVQSTCRVIENVDATDDNRLFVSLVRAVNIVGVWCNYEGAAPTTPATFTLEDGGGTAMTITGTNPTCAAPGTPATVAAVTANNALAAREVLRFDVTNTPNPATDTYMLCVSYQVSD